MGRVGLGKAGRLSMKTEVIEQGSNFTRFRTSSGKTTACLQNIPKDTLGTRGTGEYQISDSYNGEDIHQELVDGLVLEKVGT